MGLLLPRGLCLGSHSMSQGWGLILRGLSLFLWDTTKVISVFRLVHTFQSRCTISPNQGTYSCTIMDAKHLSM